MNKYDNRNKRRDRKTQKKKWGIRVDSAAKYLAQVIQNKLRKKNGNS